MQYESAPANVSDNHSMPSIPSVVDTQQPHPFASTSLQGQPPNAPRMSSLLDPSDQTNIPSSSVQYNSSPDVQVSSEAYSYPQSFTPHTAYANVPTPSPAPPAPPIREKFFTGPSDAPRTQQAPERVNLHLWSPEKPLHSSPGYGLVPQMMPVRNPYSGSLSTPFHRGMWASGDSSLAHESSTWSHSYGERQAAPESVAGRADNNRLPSARREPYGRPSAAEQNIPLSASTLKRHEAEERTRGRVQYEQVLKRYATRLFHVAFIFIS